MYTRKTMATPSCAVQAREMMYHKTNINRIMSEYTGQTVEQVEADTDRDRYMSPLEAKKYGIIDEVRAALCCTAAGRRASLSGADAVL